MKRHRLLALAVLLAACNRGSSDPSMRLSQPSALAIFHGYTDRHDALWPYAAVANSAQDELIMFDAVQDRPVSAPILLRPLSIPLPAPRPAFLASARFQPPSGDPRPRPSLLAVVSAGSSEVQLIRTWRDTSPVPAVGPGLADEDPVDVGGEVLALVAAPVVTGSGEDVQVEPDRVRVIAALAGGQVAVVEYAWSGDPEAGGSAAAVGPAIVRNVGFDALSLAVDPRDLRFVYAATLDPIPPSSVMGVAQLDMRPAPASWTPRAIAARAPTRLVAAFTLRERALTAVGAYDQATPIEAGDLAGDFQATPVHRVYAWRDPAACGPRTSVACGIAVLDPVAGTVLADPWRPAEDLAPITLPSRPLAMIVGQPAANPPSSDQAGEPPAEAMLIAPLSPSRLTTGVLLLPSEDGRSYFADLARWETPSSVLELSPTSGAGVFSFLPSSTLVPQLGFYGTKDGAPEWDPGTSAGTQVVLTPGFTATDQWTVTFQGYLPDFASSRAVQVEAAGGENLRVSFQIVPPGGTTATQIVNVHDPIRGVRVGDIVEFWTDGSSGSDTPECPDTLGALEEPPIEGKIVAIERPDGAHPGGSLVVQKGDCVPWARGGATACEDQQRGPWTLLTNAQCWDLLQNGPRLARIRAGSGTAGNEEFVVAGALTGYAGRAVSTPTHPGAVPSFAFTNENEATLVQECTTLLSSDPDCAGACRTTCERAAIARRARRLHLTSVACNEGGSATGGYCANNFPGFVRPGDPGALFPPPEGPALAFSVGWREVPVSTTPKILVRGTRVTFNTRSGRVPASRWGGGGNDGPATLPTGGAWFDRSADTTWERTGDRYRFFVPHVGNLVLDLSPSEGNGGTRVLR